MFDIICTMKTWNEIRKAAGKKFANDAERVAHLFDLYAATVKVV